MFHVMTYRRSWFLKMMFTSVLFFGAFCWVGSAARGADALQRSEDLVELSIEDLMQVKVTSVSRRSQEIAQAAAAVFVIDQEDIRRSGATTIAETLRMVPGIQVAKIDANKWAITSRGFNGRFANKLLVLIDGRTVYTPLFSGVYWDQQDTLLEDIDRIEVIRGPGAALWGANAVNGVINVITKHARETQGGLAIGSVGTEERGAGAVRYGDTLGDSSHYRFYAKAFDRDQAVFSSGQEAADGWRYLHGGFRFDHTTKNDDDVTVLGNLYTGESGETVIRKSLDPTLSATFDDDREIAGANLLGRWKRVLSDSSEMTLQCYYDYTDVDSAILGQIHDTFDMDFQHGFTLGKRHEILWGLGYRYVKDRLGDTSYTAWDPDSRETDLLSAFLQDEITFFDNLHFTVGSKFEHNDYTGFEIQPNARILWQPRTHQSVWAAVSQVVRTPSRAEANARINNRILTPGSLLPAFPGYGIVALLGSEEYDSEELLAYELGYRVQLADKLVLDMATFFNDYDNLRTLEPGTSFLETSPSPTHLVIPYVANNKMKGETYGFELAADWLALDWWRLQLSYTYLDIFLKPDDDSGDTTSESAEGESPHNQISVRSSMDLPMDLELDLWARYCDSLPSQNIPSYLTLDVRLAWKATDRIEISAVGQNLFDRSHPEYEPEFIDTLPTEVERGVYGKVVLQF